MHWFHWFYDGFGVFQLLVSMVFNGHGPLVKRCDGFNVPLTSKRFPFFFFLKRRARLIMNTLSQIHIEIVPLMSSLNKDLEPAYHSQLHTWYAGACLISTLAYIQSCVGTGRSYGKLLKWGWGSFSIP